MTWWFGSTIGFAFVAAIAAAGVAAENAAPAAPARTIDFDRDVQPILQTRCFACHGPNKQQAHLRLDLPDLEKRRGDSGRPLIGKEPQESELLHRVTGEGVEVRMPLEGEPLTAEQIETLKLWVAQRINEGDAPPMVRAKRDLSPAEEPLWYAGILEWLGPAITWTDWICRDYSSLLYAAMGFFLVLLVVERGKRTAESEEASPGLIATICGWVTMPVYFAAILGICGWGFHLYSLTRDQSEAKLEESNKILRLQVEKLIEKESSHLAEKKPPTAPPRPRHPKRLGGEYYRGNDQRSDQLYNGGFYRTATMRLALCGDDKQPLAWGSDVPPGKLFIRLEIERAKNASPALFGENLMGGTFLSRHTVAEEEVPDLAQEIVLLTTTVPGEKFVAYYPLTSPAAGAQESSLSGQVIIYCGGLPKQKRITATPHFGIVYDLHFQNGKVATSSELWMGSLYYWWPQLEHPSPGKVPLNEWFDFRPIPEIEGANSTDPKLLGIPEHLPAKSASEKK